MQYNPEYILGMFKNMNPENKDESIKVVMEKYSFKKSTALYYFYQWKKLIKGIPQKEGPVDYDARIKEYVDSQKEEDVPCDPMNAPRYLREKKCDFVGIKKAEEELPKVEVSIDPEDVIEAAKEMHSVNESPIREFTEDEKREIETIESEKQAAAPKGVEFNISMILEGKTFTFRIDKDGIKIEEVDDQYKLLTQECVDEQQRALDILKIFNRCFGKEGFMNEA